MQKGEEQGKRRENVASAGGKGICSIWMHNREQAIEPQQQEKKLGSTQPFGWKHQKMSMILQVTREKEAQV